MLIKHLIPCCLSIFILDSFCWNYFIVMKLRQYLMLVKYKPWIIDSTGGIALKEMLMNRHMKENGIWGKKKKKSPETNSPSFTHKPFPSVNFSVPSCLRAVIRCLDDRFQGSLLPVSDLKCHSSIFYYRGYWQRTLGA